MPLFKKKASKREDDDSEMGPQPKDLAMAFGIQKRNKKKMAKGGEIDLRDEKESEIDDASDSREMSMLDGHSTKRPKELDLPDESPRSIADAVMRKKRMMAKGGEVDLQANSNEDLNMEDQLSFDAARKDTYYDDSQLDAQPMDSNEHGDDLSDEDKHGAGMIAEIMRKMRSKRS